MPVFKLYYKILISNISSVILYFFIFMALSIFLSSSGKISEEKTFQETSIKITIIDRDHSKLSEALTDYISKTHHFVDIPDDMSKLADAMYYRKIEYILIIPKEFETDFLSGNTRSLENIKIPDSYTGYLLDTQINEYLQDSSTYIASGLPYEQALEKSKTLSNSKLEIKFLDGKQITDAKPRIYHYFKYLPYVLISMIICGFSPVFLSLFQPDNRRRIVCSSLSLKSFNLQLISASLLYALGVWILLFTLGCIIYPNNLSASNIGFVIINSLCMTAVSMSLGYFIGFVSKNEVMISGASTVIGMGMSFLGGVFAPLELLSKNVLIFSKLLPTYWYTQNNEFLFQGMDLTQVQQTQIYQGFIIQILFAVTIFIISLLFSKLQREHTKQLS